MMAAPTRQQLEAWDRHHFWHPFTQMAEYEPLVFQRAQGCTLVDWDGREYLDGVSSLWCNVHGHREPRIDAAIEQQLRQLAHSTALGASSVIAIRLARRLAELAPGDLDHVYFSSDGASAMEVALKMAFQFWRQCETPRPGKTRYISLESAYHGDTLGCVSVGGVARFHQMFEPLLFEVIRAPAPDPRRLPEGTLGSDAADAYLQPLAELLEQHHPQVAALVVEPLVQCAAGMIMHPPGFLRGVRELTAKYDVLLVADEIATGFGRTGTMFACEQEGVVPDLMSLGKGITGGYLPLAATLATPRVFRAFLGREEELCTFFHGHTYAGNPLAAAAAVANLEIFAEDRTLEKLVPKIARLQEHLGRLAQHPHVASPRQRGMIAAMELVQDKASASPFPARDRVAWRVCREAMRRGVWLRPLRDTLVIMPPLAIQIDQLDFLMETLGQSIEAITGVAAKSRD